MFGFEMEQALVGSLHLVAWFHLQFALQDGDAIMIDTQRPARSLFKACRRIKRT